MKITTKEKIGNFNHLRELCFNIKINNKPRWIKFRRNYGNRKWYFSKLTDGFVLHFLWLTVIARLK